VAFAEVSQLPLPLLKLVMINSSENQSSVCVDVPKRERNVFCFLTLPLFKFLVS